MLERGNFMLNSCVLMGRFVHSPEVRKTSGENVLTKFSIAVNRKPGNEGVDFIDCIAWNKTAEFICKYFKKGDPIIVQGKIETNQYEDKQGNKRKKYEVVVREIDFCLSKKTEKQDSAVELDSDDDLPFGD